MVLNSSLSEIKLFLVIQPKASRDKVVGMLGTELKIAITAPPVDGKANEYLKKYLAKQFKTSQGKVIIHRGEASHHKEVIIQDAKCIPEEFAPYIKQ